MFRADELLVALTRADIQFLIIGGSRSAYTDTFADLRAEAGAHRSQRRRKLRADGSELFGIRRSVV